MKRIATAILLFMALGASADLTLAGECTESAEHYVSCLERWAETRPLDGAAAGEISEAFSCLVHTRWVHWAGPVAARYFRNLHASPLGPRIIAASARYLELPVSSTGKDLAYEAAYTLAMYGAKHVNGSDVLEELTSRGKAANRSLPYFALASIGDPRVLSLLHATYDSLAAAPRSQRVHSDKVELVCCLYHIPGDSALALARAIASADPDSFVRTRAEHVVVARSQ